MYLNIGTHSVYLTKEQLEIISESLDVMYGEGCYIENLKKFAELKEYINEKLESVKRYAGMV